MHCFVFLVSPPSVRINVPADTYHLLHYINIGFFCFLNKRDLFTLFKSVHNLCISRIPDG